MSRRHTESPVTNENILSHALVAKVVSTGDKPRLDYKGSMLAPLERSRSTYFRNQHEQLRLDAADAIKTLRVIDSVAQAEFDTIADDEVRKQRMHEFILDRRDAFNRLVKTRTLFVALGSAPVAALVEVGDTVDIGMVVGFEQPLPGREDVEIEVIVQGTDASSAVLEIGTEPYAPIVVATYDNPTQAPPIPR